jgi:hemolysin activation/secretion protein
VIWQARSQKRGYNLRGKLAEKKSNLGKVDMSVLVQKDCRSVIDFRRRAIGLVTLCGLTGMAQVAEAQTAAAPPPLDAAPRVSREEVDIAKPERENSASRVSIDSRRAVERGPCPLEESDVQADIQTVRFETPDNSALPPEIARLLAGIGPVTQGQQRIAAVCDIRDRANAALRSGRYIAGVQIPAQEITTGELRLVVVLGRITNVVVNGDPSRFRNTLEARIEEMKSKFPLNETELERLLLITGDTPGLDVTLSLRSAGGQPGELLGELNIEASRGALYLNVQNTGSHQLGRVLATVRGELYGLTGLDDLTYLTYTNSAQWREQHVVQGGHEFALNQKGLRLGGRVSYAESRPSLENLSILTRSVIAGVELSQPLVRQVGKTLRASTGLEYSNQRTVILSSGSRFPFTRDRTSVAYARLDGSIRDPRADGDNNWAFGAGLEVRKGLDILKASPRRQFVNSFSPSRFDGDAKATIVRGELDTSFRLAKGVWFTAQAQGQWSNNALLNLEEFSIGNLTIGRGYDPGSNGGDRVVAFRIEPRVRPIDKRNFRLEFAGFYDNVRFWNLDNGTIETNRKLDSIGGSVRMMFGRRAILDVTYAKPLQRALSTDLTKPTDRILISLTTKLLPWR